MHTHTHRHIYKYIYICRFPRVQLSIYRWLHKLPQTNCGYPTLLDPSPTLPWVQLVFSNDAPGHPLHIVSQTWGDFQWERCILWHFLEFLNGYRHHKLHNLTLWSNCVTEENKGMLNHPIILLGTNVYIYIYIWTCVCLYWRNIVLTH